MTPLVLRVTFLLILSLAGCAKGAWSESGVRARLIDEAMLDYEQGRDAAALSKTKEAARLQGSGNPQLFAAHILIFQDFLSANQAHRSEALELLRIPAPDPLGTKEAKLYAAYLAQERGVLDLCSKPQRLSVVGCYRSELDHFSNFAAASNSRFGGEQEVLFSEFFWNETGNSYFLARAVIARMRLDFAKGIQFRKEQERRGAFDSVARAAYCDLLAELPFEYLASSQQNELRAEFSRCSASARAQAPVQILGAPSE